MASEEPLVSADKELRIVLLGRFSDGKSSVSDTILGEPKFNTCATETCKVETRIIEGKKVTVVDTPGLFRPGTKEEEVLKEIKKSIKLANPGPHVFLIVLKVDDPFTEELQQMVKLICSTFGNNTMAYTMVLFTYGNRLDHLPIEDYFCEDSNLHNLIIQCHWKYHVFDNKHRTQNPDQVGSLLEKINGMIERSRGSYYSPEMLQKAEKALEEQQQQQQAQNLEAEGKKAKMGPVQTSALVGVCVGCLTGYLFGGGEISSSIGALLGALAGVILGIVVAGLWILGKRHIKKCPQKCCC